MKLLVKPHTVNILVGPTCCGKSYFAGIAQKLINESGSGLKCHVVSSDEIRRMLIGENLDKHDPRMLEVSQQTFDLLFAQLENLMSYPVVSDYIFVDTTGLGDNFRSRILDLAAKLNYSVEITLFCYKNRNDFSAGLAKGQSAHVMSRQIRKMFTEEIQKITGRFERPRYAFINRLDKRIDSSFNVEINPTPLIGTLDHNKATLIIGDVHGAYDKLIQVLNRGGVKIIDGLFQSPMQIVFVGDIIDKSPRAEVEKCLDLILPNIQAGTAMSCLGNHERFFANSKRTDKTKDTPQDVISNYFNSSLETDPDFVNKVLSLHDLSKCCIKGAGFVITHSPCHEIFIGKLAGKSIVRQVNWRYTDMSDEEFDKEFNDFFKDRSRNSPRHIFGHIPCDKAYSGLNWLCIDTQASAGGKLTACIVKPWQVHSKDIEFIRSDGEQIPGKKLQKTSTATSLQTVNNLMTGRDRGRVHFMIENKVNFISGTMSPVNAMEGNLENIKWGLEYYRTNNIDEVWLSPKMMGSRAQVYLFPNPADCYLISRNGFKVKEVPSAIFMDLISRFSLEFENSLRMRILDAELMPWSFLGKGLIDDTFLPAHYLAKNENELNQRLGFYEAFASIGDRLNDDYGKMSKTEFINKHGHHVYKTYHGYYQMKPAILGYEESRGFLNTYKTRLDKYCQEGPPSLYPFAILKDVYSDHEAIYGYGTNLYENFVLINDTPILRCKTWEIEKATEFFHEIGTNQLLEGVVMRPVIDTKDIAPFFKVRHPDYLMLAYDYDYQGKTKLDRLINRKRITKKMRNSISDYESGMDMLQIPYSNINSPEMIDLMVRYIKTESTENMGIDPRL